MEKIVCVLDVSDMNILLDVAYWKLKDFGVDMTSILEVWLEVSAIDVSAESVCWMISVEAVKTGSPRTVAFASYFWGKHKSINCDCRRDTLILFQLVSGKAELLVTGKSITTNARSLASASVPSLLAGTGK